MRKLRKWLKYLLPALMALLLASLLLSRVFRPEGEPRVSITAFQAAEHVGRSAEVCGLVASADFIPQIGGEPTFLNLGRPHPDQPFTAVIWGRDRAKWNVPPERYYAGRQICVSGRLGMHRGTPQIVVSDPARIRFR